MKASGLDMIIAHRLLKNRIRSNEYILTTLNYLNLLSNKQFPSYLTWQQSAEEYSIVGKIEYQYALLEKIKNHIRGTPKIIESAIELGRDSLGVGIKVPLLRKTQMVT